MKRDKSESGAGGRMMELGKGINLCNNSGGYPGEDFFFFFFLNSLRDFIMVKISQLTFIHCMCRQQERERARDFPGSLTFLSSSSFK